MELNEDLVDLESKGKTKKGKISKKEAAKRIGITYAEFRNYLKMSEKGQISWNNSKDNSYSYLYNTNINLEGMLIA